MTGASPVVIVGATASGKTDLALALARRLGGEVISADSRQVYRGLDAGTAKPPRDARGLCEGVPCHLLDVAEPGEPYDAGRWAREAARLCGEIAARGRLPIVAGGTGLYVKALLEGLAELPGRDEAVRRRLEEEAARSGRAALHARLARVDPEAAAAIPANNLQRVMRALEVHELTGRPLTEHWRRRAPGLPARAVLRLDWPASELSRRIEERARAMWPAMLAEAAALSDRLAGDEPGLESLGYAEALACARGRLGSREGLESLISSTRAYAKRQRTWLRTQLRATPIAGGTLERMTADALAAIGALHETTAA